MKFRCAVLIRNRPKVGRSPEELKQLRDSTPVRARQELRQSPGPDHSGSELLAEYEGAATA